MNTFVVKMKGEPPLKIQCGGHRLSSDATHILLEDSSAAAGNAPKSSGVIMTGNLEYFIKESELLELLLIGSNDQFKNLKPELDALERRLNLAIAERRRASKKKGPVLVEAK